MSWDANAAATTCPSMIELAVWSPCSRFIAIARTGTTILDILDSVTLQQLQTLEPPHHITVCHEALAFSPDSRVLTCCSCDNNYHNSRIRQELFTVSWDLQTGGVISVIKQQQSDDGYTVEGPSITYSTNGKMVGVFQRYHRSNIIFIHDIISGIHMHSHLLNTCSTDSRLSLFHCFIPKDIWTHGESLRFMTIEETYQFTTVGEKRTTIAIWEVGFTSGTAPVEVETFSLLGRVLPKGPAHYHHNHHSEVVGLLPASYQFAIVHEGQVTIRDARNPKSLLSPVDVKCRPRMSFSSSGRFFACSTIGTIIYLWKESPTGYILHGTLVSTTEHSTPVLSPNGKSVAVFGGRTIQLWHTKGFTTPSSIPSRSIANFTLGFSPDGALVAIARKGRKVATVLDLKSGLLRLTISVGLSVYGLRLARGAVVVICNRKAITWNIPAGEHISYARAILKDSVRSINLAGRRRGSVFTALISPNFRYIALTTVHLFSGSLYVYNASTGERLGCSGTVGATPWFTPDGNGIRCIDHNGNAEGWDIIRDRRAVDGEVVGNRSSNSILVATGTVVGVRDPSEGYPWASSRYQITDDGWVLGPGGKRLLMLPPPWRSDPMQREWNGRFLALLHGALSEPVILELEP